MKDSQLRLRDIHLLRKYIKANNERFSTNFTDIERACISISRRIILNSTQRVKSSSISISRRIMKDSQPVLHAGLRFAKYIKANNERFSTRKELVPVPG